MLEVTTLKNNVNDGFFNPRVDYDVYRVLWINEGKGTISVNFQPFDVLANQVYFFSPNQIVSLIDADIETAAVLVFSDEFLYSNPNDDDFLNKCHLLDNPNSPFITVTENDYVIKELWSLIDIESNSVSKMFQSKILRNYLKAFLLQSERVKYSVDANPQLTEDCIIFLSFKNNISENIRANKSVSDYADSLNITPKRLNRILRKLVGKTPYEYISHRVILEAKRQLHFESKSIKEIAFNLGFSDASNFTRTFKKKEGQAPETFRNSLL